MGPLLATTTLIAFLFPPLFPYWFFLGLLWLLWEA